MAPDLENGPPSVSLSRAQQFGSFAHEPVVETRWNKFLNELGLTEPEVLNAIFRDGEVGHLIRRFVDDFSHNHFVPEDVLRALNRQGALQCEREKLAAHLI